jgi:hypothetical protein
MKFQISSSLCDLINEVCFILIKSCTILIKDVMEPHLGYRVTLPRPPWHIGLRPTEHKSPRNCPYLFLLKLW